MSSEMGVFVVGDDGFITSGGASSLSPAWKIRSAGTTRNLNGIAINGERMIVVGDDGLIRISRDGGATWIDADRGSKTLRAVV
jgi:hypothetical protein